MNTNSISSQEGNDKKKLVKRFEISDEKILDLKQILNVIIDKVLDEIGNELEHINTPHEEHCLHHNDTRRRHLLLPLIKNAGIEILDHKQDLGIYQLKVLKQKDPHSCGYHSFHNAYNIMKASLGKNAEYSLLYLNKIINVTSEHSRRFRIRRFFKVKDSKSQLSFLTALHYKKFLMERMHMKYLVKKFNESVAIGGLASLSALSELNFSSLKNSMLDKANALKLQTIFDQFQQLDNCSHAFLIGLSNHWATLFVNKVTFNVFNETIGRFEKQTSIEYFYLDSRNDPILTPTEEDFKRLIKAYYDMKERVAGWPVDYRPWREQTYLQSLKDSGWIIDMLYQGINGKINFLSYYLDLIVEGILEKFHTYVPYQEDSNIDLLMSLLGYLENCPPKVIEEDLLLAILKVGEEYLSVGTKQKLQDWIFFIYSIPEVKTFNQALVQRFLNIIEKLKTQILKI